MVCDVGETEIEKSPAVSVAEAELPVPPLVELTLPVVLSLDPEVMGVTFTLTAHEPLAATVPPLRLIEVLPAVAVNVPPHVLLALGVAATCRPDGKLSVTETPLKAVPVFGLVMVSVSEVVPFTGMFVAPKALAMDGGATTTMLADAIPPFPASADVTAPVVLFFVPALVPVTLTAKLHVALAANVAPIRLRPFAPAVAVIAPPPQLPVRPFGVATTKPEGSVSVNPIPLRELFPFGFETLNVSEVVPFSAMDVVPNALPMVGGASTVSVAVLLVAPGPVSVALIAPVVLVLTPAVVPVTFTTMMQEPLAASVPPERLMEPEPAAAVTAPPHTPVRPFGLETTSPEGKLSVKAMPLRDCDVFGLLIVKVRLVLPPTGIVDAPKVLLMVGGPATMRLAESVLPVPPLVELTAPVVLFLMPKVVPVTFTEMVHELSVATVPPVRLIELEPTVAVEVPPQLDVRPLGVATTRPEGSVSLKATPASATELATGLLMVKVKLLVPFKGIVVGLKALAIKGGATTTMLADAVPPLPASVDVTALVVLFFAPALVPVTLTAKLHVAPPPSVAPVRLMLLVAAFAEIVPPPQAPATPFDVATTKPVGSVSVNPIPLRELPAFGFARLNVSEVVPFSAMDVAPNALPMVGGASTVTVAVLLVVPWPLSVAVIAPVVLFWTPVVVPVTLTTMVQEPLAASVPPLRLMELEPAAAVTAPPHIPLTTLGVDTTTPEGKASVKEMPLRDSAVFGLLMVKVRLVPPPTEIVDAPKAFMIVGGEATTRLAVAVLPVPPLVELTAPVVLV